MVYGLTTSTKKLILAKLGVSRTIYVNVDTPNLGFTYLNFLGGLYGGYGIFNGMVGILWLYIWWGTTLVSNQCVSVVGEQSLLGSATMSCAVSILLFPITLIIAFYFLPILQ